MTTEVFYVEVSIPSAILRMQFVSKRKANNARRKIAKNMGKFRNDESTVEIVSSTSTYSIDCREVRAVSVIDALAWNEMAKLHQEEAPALVADRAN